MPEGPNKDAPVDLLKTWNPSLTIWTYCVLPTSPLVSGGAQLHATPGNGMPSKLSSGVGTFVDRKVRKVNCCATSSGLSLCLLGIFGFSLASRSGFSSKGNCFISRKGFDLSL